MYIYGCGLLKVHQDPTKSSFDDLESLLQMKDTIILFNNDFFYADKEKKEIKKVEAPDPNWCWLLNMSDSDEKPSYEEISSILKEKDGVILINEDFFFADSRKQEIHGIEILDGQKADFDSLKSKFTQSYKLADSQELKLIELTTGRKNIKQVGYDKLKSAFMNVYTQADEEEIKIILSLTNHPQNKLIQKITDIEIEFGFEENYLLLHLIKLFKYDINSYEFMTIKKRKERPANIKNELKRMQALLTRTQQKLIQSSFIIQPYHDDLQTAAKAYIDQITENISLINDIGGRPSGSLQQFLIFHLVKMYLLGTKKKFTCNWHASNETGAGETYKFLIAINNILPEINSKFTLRSKKSICTYAIEIYKEFKNDRIFSTT